MREKYPDAKTYMSEKDVPLLAKASLNLSNMLPEAVTCAAPDVCVKEGDRITLDSMEFTVLETPGHTPGGLSFYSEKDGVVFTGDSLFRDLSAGRIFPAAA